MKYAGSNTLTFDFRQIHDENQFKSCFIIFFKTSTVEQFFRLAPGKS